MSTSISVFNVIETTIDDIHSAYQSGQLTARQLVQTYLDRISAYDKQGPAINAIITVNSRALDEADRLDAAFKASGFVGALHGIPIIIKDQADARGMPTTLGSVLFANYLPDRDAFVVEELKNAGAIILAKATLGELGGGDTHGSLFGSTRNPYDLERTAGGSSGGSGHGRRRTGRLCVDPPPLDMELDRRYAAHRGSGEPRWRLRRMAIGRRFSWPHGPHRHRLGEAIGRYGRL